MALTTPASLGFRMPAEWSPHRGTWLSWPHRESSWPRNFAPVPGVVAEMVRHLAPGEEVHINVADDALEASAREVLRASGVPTANVFFHRNPTNDAWCRDHGPIFVQRDLPAGGGEELILDWGYNAWGGKYPPFDLDDQIPQRVAAEFGIPFESPGMILEGGSIDVNGRGTLLTSEQCLLHPNRNPKLGKTEIENYLRAYLGVRHFIWLKEGIAGDDTDGHIDDIARFVNPTTVLCARQPDENDPDHAVLEENFRLLEAATDQDGNKLRVIPLPVPGWVGDQQGKLPASYANFYIGNTKVLVPLFDTENDAAALEVLQSVFPDRKVVGINARYLVYGLGTFHCMTQQQPAV